MSCRVRVLRLLPVFLLIGACGGSSKSGTSSGSTTSAAAAAETGPAATQTAGKSTSKPTPSRPTTTASTGSTRGSTSPPGSSGGGSTSPPGSSGGGSTSARVPATFAIEPGGKLSPLTVSSPAFLAVQLTVASGDGRAHHVTIRTPALYSLIVPAHAAATALIRGLRAGRYDIVVDGATGGALLIGGEPGP